MHVGHQTMGNGWHHNSSMITQDCIFVLTTNSLFEFITCCKLSQSNKNLFLFIRPTYTCRKLVPAEIS